MLLRNVLIFHAGALGDFLQTWPLGLALGRLYPQSRIIYITHAQKGALAEQALRLDSADIESGWHHLFGDCSKLPENCRRKLQYAHLIISFIAKPDDAWMKTVAAIAGGAKLISITPGPWHQIRESLTEAPVIQAAIRQIETSIAARGIGISKPSENGPIAIHPGSGSKEKCWPLDSYLELIQMLQSSGRACRIFLGEVELERWKPQQIDRLHAACEVIQPATYLDLMRDLTQCSAFIGNDTGPGHLAAMIGLNSLILFGPTDPTLWKPLGPGVRTLRAQPLDSLAPEDVFTEFQKFPAPSISPVLDA